MLLYVSQLSCEQSFTTRFRCRLRDWGSTWQSKKTPQVARSRDCGLQSRTSSAVSPDGEAYRWRWYERRQLKTIKHRLIYAASTSVTPLHCLIFSDLDPNELTNSTESMPPSTHCSYGGTMLHQCIETWQGSDTQDTRFRRLTPLSIDLLWDQQRFPTTRPADCLDVQ